MFETLLSFAIILILSLIFKSLYGNVNSVKEGINAVVLNVMLPALCIKTFDSAQIIPSLLLVPASAWLIIIPTTILGYAVARLVSRFTSLNDRDIGVLVIVSGFGNLIYLGAPVLASLYGNEAVKYALLFDFLAGTILVWTLAAFVASYYSDREAFNLRASIRTIVTLPPLWGIALGVLLNLIDIRPESFILKALDMLSQSVTPLMIFSIGLSLKIPPLKYAFILVPFVFIKLLISPLIAFHVTGMFHIDEIARKSIVMESAMPVMILLLVVAAKYKLNESLTALAITLSTALSFITLPLVAYMLDRFI